VTENNLLKSTCSHQIFGHNQKKRMIFLFQHVNHVVQKNLLRGFDICHESIDHKCTSDCCCHGQHKVVETDKRRHTRKYVDEDCCRTAPRHTRQESNIIS
jgi:hypothetical protein